MSPDFHYILAIISHLLTYLLAYMVIYLLCEQAKQKEVAAILTKTASDIVADGTPSVDVAIHPLQDAWSDVNKQMEYRKMLLDQSVAFHSSAIQVTAGTNLPGRHHTVDWGGHVQPTFARSQWSSGSTLACGARGPRFESRCGQKFVFSRKSSQYTALGTGCTLTAVPRSTQPSTLRGTVNEYQPYG